MVLGVFLLFARAFLLGRLIYIIIVPHGFMSHVPCNPPEKKSKLRNPCRNPGVPHPHLERPAPSQRPPRQEQPRASRHGGGALFGGPHLLDESPMEVVSMDMRLLGDSSTVETPYAIRKERAPSAFIARANGNSSLTAS